MNRNTLNRKSVSFCVTFLMVMAMGACNKNDNSVDTSKNRSGFQTILIEESVSGDMLYFKDVDQYKLYLQDSIQYLTDKELKLYLSDVSYSSNWYPLINIIYKTPALCLYFIAYNKGADQRLYLITFKDNKKVDAENLSQQCDFNNLRDLGKRLILDERVNKGESYNFNIFSDKHSPDYFNIKISLDGKIEIEKIKVAEGDIP